MWFVSMVSIASLCLLDILVSNAECDTYISGWIVVGSLLSGSGSIQFMMFLVRSSVFTGTLYMLKAAL